MKKVFLFSIISVVIIAFTLTMIPLALEADTAWMSATESYLIPDAGITRSWTQPDGIGISFVVVKLYQISNPSNFESELFFQDADSFITGIGTPTITVTWPPGSCNDYQAVIEYRWSETVRTSELACQMVWINGDGHFQFSFINLYADNNWVKIYDMEGNMVYEANMPTDNGNLIVDLSDGMYTVKTFHDQPDPIQEFVIGKPAPEAEM